MMKSAPSPASRLRASRPKCSAFCRSRPVAGLGAVLLLSAAPVIAEPKPQLDRRIRALWIDSFKLGNREGDHELKGYRLKTVLNDQRVRPMANVWVRSLKIGPRTGFQDVRFFVARRGGQVYRVHRVLRRTPIARYRDYLAEAIKALGPETSRKLTTNRLERIALHIWTTNPRARPGERLEYRMVWRRRLKGDGSTGTLVRTLIDGAAWARHYRGGGR
jgi:hypothetical protein